MSGRRYPGPAVDLPLDGWLYEAKPHEGCERCAELMRQLGAAKERGDANARFEAARAVRNCRHGVERQ